MLPLISAGNWSHYMMFYNTQTLLAISQEREKQRPQNENDFNFAAKFKIRSKNLSTSGNLDEMRMR